MFTSESSPLSFISKNEKPAFSRLLDPEDCPQSVASKLVSGAISNLDHPHFFWLNHPKPQYVSISKNSPKSPAQKLDLPFTKDTYTSAEEYVDIFCRLIDKEEEHQKKVAESWIVKDVPVEWERDSSQRGGFTGFFHISEEERKRGQLTLDTRFKIIQDTWTAEAVIVYLEDGGFTCFSRVKQPPPFGENFTIQKIFNNFSFAQLKKGLDRFLPKTLEYRSFISKEVASMILGCENSGLEKLVSENLLKDSAKNLETHQAAMNTDMMDKFDLNLSQRKAALEALGDSPISLIQGPPGTGKTLTSVAIIAQLVQKIRSGEKILVCAPSNTAIDDLTLKLIQAGLQNVIRVYSGSRERTQRINPTLKDISLLSKALAKSHEFGEKIINDPLFGFGDDSGTESDFFSDFHHSERLNRGPFPFSRELYSIFQEEMRKGFPKRPHYFKELHSKINQGGHLLAKELESYRYLKEKFEYEVLEEARIVCCTCSTASQKILQNFAFQNVFIDEAAQCSEPETLIPLTLGAKKVILVGDDKQLGPIFNCEEVKSAGLDRSLFERLLPRVKHEMLDYQYRMHDLIAEFPSKNFYDGKLKTHHSVFLNHDKNSISFFRFKPLRFINIESPEERLGTSWTNPKEAKVIIRFTKFLVKNGVNPMNIGIITPYAKQKELLQDRIPKHFFLSQVKIASVDEFQGGEKDYILLSTVRSNTERNIGFLRDERRLNVAITRARYGLVIFGNTELLSFDENWKKLIEFCENKRCLQNENLEPINIFGEKNENQNKNEDSLKALLERMKKLRIQTNTPMIQEEKN